MRADELPPPVQMTQLLAGFQLSQALYAAAVLGVADHLLAGPAPVAVSPVILVMPGLTPARRDAG
jgi:hypothetical protein